jgi:acyl-CoA synthetase (AMP-forming)/AMP-acid ligase II
MAGYLPGDANADAFVDGRYRTGDVGWLETEGWVHLTDRSKEMIKVNGFQVVPAEVEAVLHGHPAVVDCAVFGVADERAGEVPVAAVQLDPNRPVAEGELERLVADSLATAPAGSSRWTPSPPSARRAAANSGHPGSPRRPSDRRSPQPTRGDLALAPPPGPATGSREEGGG